jgi:hypothetical protein
MTAAEKDLCLASLEWTLAYAKYRMGLESLATLENAVAQVQARELDDPEYVTWSHLAYVYNLLQGFTVKSARVLAVSAWLAKVSASSSASITGKFDGSALFDGTLSLTGAA